MATTSATFSLLAWPSPVTAFFTVFAAQRTTGTPCFCRLVWIWAASRESNRVVGARANAVFSIATTSGSKSPVSRVTILRPRLRRARRVSSSSTWTPDGLPSQPTLSRLLRTLSSERNRAGLDEALLEMADRRHGLRWRGPLREATLDLDSLAVEVHGHQPGTAYNDHFRCRCYHPLVLHWNRGDFLAARLRPGNAHTADGALDFALPAIRWARQRVRRLWLRIDAGFPSAEFLDAVEAEGLRYVARVRTNPVLERKAAPYVTRPPGRPPKDGRTWTHELTYRAGTWSRERRIVLVVTERPGDQGHLFLDHFFLLTNAPEEEVPAEEVMERYRRRGRAEKDFGDWKSGLELRLSSSPRPKAHYRGRRLREPEPRRDSFAVNDAWLTLNLLAANLLELARSLYERATRQQLSRRRFRQIVLKVATRITLGSRRVTVILGTDRAPDWAALWRALTELHPVRGSPAPEARLLPA